MLARTSSYVARSQLSAALLEVPNPASMLSRWLEEMAPAELAMVLHSVVARLRSGHPCSALRETTVSVAAGGRKVLLDLLLMPCIFAPEAWGRTFLEGILRGRLCDGERILELGAGSGWVSLALLRLTERSRVVAVDLNPRAVLVSRLNALLNSFDAGGRPLPGAIHERFQSLRSDLLSEPRRRGYEVDVVVGCIPQVITRAADLESDQGLYDLSNYCVAQGLEEDALGLGLNARALHEALHVLAPGGRVILNLAGRPGEAALTQMFRRRGFEATVLHRARVQQAADTDIQSMVEAERGTDAPFSFYLDPHGGERVSAEVAHAARESGSPIFHDVLVIEGTPRSQALLDLAVSFGALGLEELPARQDLRSVPDEQARFVAQLARRFHHEPRAPYPHEAGDLSFRRRVTGVLREVHGAALSAEEVFVAPSRREALHAMLLALVEPEEPVLVHRDLEAVYRPVLAKRGQGAVWMAGDGAGAFLPGLALRPRMVVIEPREDAGDLRRLLRACEEIDATLVLDETRRFSPSPGDRTSRGSRSSRRSGARGTSP